MSQSSIISESPAQTFIVEEALPAQSIVYSQAPAQSVALSAQAVALESAVSVVAAPAARCNLDRWADYSPENVELGFPDLPAPDYKCYQPPQVPPGQTRYLKVDEPAQLKNLEQNFNDVRTAIRENNTHVQRNRTQITNVNRNHNHLLRIVTNENNFEHNLTNKIVRVADTHRQKIENVKGETRNFKDYKQTQKVEAQGCRRSDAVVVQAAPAAACAPAPAAVSVAASAPALSVVQSAATASILAPATPTEVQYIQSGVTLSVAPSLARSSRLQ